MGFNPFTFWRTTKDPVIETTKARTKEVKKEYSDNVGNLLDLMDETLLVLKPEALIEDHSKERTEQ